MEVANENGGGLNFNPNSSIHDDLLRVDSVEQAEALYSSVHSGAYNYQN